LNSTLTLIKNDVAEPSAKSDTPTVALNITKSENNSTQCKHRQVKLSERRLPLTGLLSFPGVPGKTIVVKAHELKYVFKFEKIVLLVRNPYDALLSYAMFSKGGHTRIPNNKTLIQASNKMFNHSLRWFFNLPNRTCSTFHGLVYILQYDLLKSDLRTELGKLAQFLNISVPQAAIDCTVYLQEGNFHRKSNAEDHLRMLRTVYDDKKLEQLRIVVRKTESILEKRFNKKFYLGEPTSAMQATDMLSAFDNIRWRRSPGKL
ncbi:WSCD2-like protein, partial [Mya arenaria]